MARKGVKICLKYSLITLNAISLVSGCGLLGLGIYTRTTHTSMNKVSAILGSHLYSALSMVLMACGGIVLVLSLLGCWAAIKEVRCMLGTVFSLLLGIFICFLVGGIIVFMNKNQIAEHTLNELYRSLSSSYGMQGKQDVTEAWDLMQNIFGCCGVEGGVNSTTSWAYYKENTEWYMNHSATSVSRKYVPDSCCKTQMMEKLKTCTGLEDPNLSPVVGPPVMAYMENEQMFTEGCYTAFNKFLEDNARIFGGLAVGLAAVLVLGMTLSMCLCKQINEDYYFD